MEAREGLLSRDCRGDVAWGVTIEGMDMDGIAIAGGCSDTTDVAGGEVGVESVDGRAAGSTFCSSTVVSSSFAPGSAADVASDNFESILDLPVSVTAAGLRNAGLSGREGASDEALGLSARLLTALASRSCSLEFGRLRD